MRDIVQMLDQESYVGIMKTDSLKMISPDLLQDSQSI